VVCESADSTDQTVHVRERLCSSGDFPVKITSADGSPAAMSRQGVQGPLRDRYRGSGDGVRRRPDPPQTEARLPGPLRRLREIPGQADQTEVRTVRDTRGDVAAVRAVRDRHPLVPLVDANRRVKEL